jgi:hypothetical protein
VCAAPDAGRYSPTARRRATAIVSPDARLSSEVSARDNEYVSPCGRIEIQRYFGPESTAEPCGHFQVLAGERHWYGRSDSWAEVYASVATALGRSTPTRAIAARVSTPGDGGIK